MTQILLADADNVVRSSLVLLLKHKLGILDVCEVEDAVQLDAHLSTCLPDILLLDWDLPGLDVARIRSEFQYEGRRPALIVMSLQSQNEPWALASGADAFLNKRASGEYVLSLLRNFIPAL